MAQEVAAVKQHIELFQGFIQCSLSSFTFGRLPSEFLLTANSPLGSSEFRVLVKGMVDSGG